MRRSPSNPKRKIGSAHRMNLLGAKIGVTGQGEIEENHKKMTPTTGCHGD